MNYLKQKMREMDQNSDGFLQVGNLILLFNNQLKALSISESRQLAEFLLKQAGPSENDPDYDAEIGISMLDSQMV